MCRARNSWISRYLGTGCATPVLMCGRLSRKGLCPNRPHTHVQNRPASPYRRGRQARWFQPGQIDGSNAVVVQCTTSPEICTAGDLVCDTFASPLFSTSATIPKTAAQTYRWLAGAGVTDSFIPATPVALLVTGALVVALFVGRPILAAAVLSGGSSMQSRLTSKASYPHQPIIFDRPQRHARANGTSFDRRILRSRVINGTRWTMLAAAINSSAGSLWKSSSTDCLQTAKSSGHTCTRAKIRLNSADSTGRLQSDPTERASPLPKEQSPRYPTNFPSAICARPASLNRPAQRGECGCQDSASHLIPVEKISPVTFTLPFMLPIRSAQPDSMGISRATGFPCFVMTMPSGSRWSSSERHCSLNFDALSCSTLQLYQPILLTGQNY
jgi:hypothetical protein